MATPKELTGTEAVDALQRVVRRWIELTDAEL